MRKYRLVKITQDEPHVKESSASEQPPQHLDGAQYNEAALANEVATVSKSFNNAAEQSHYSLSQVEQRPPGGAGSTIATVAANKMSNNVEDQREQDREACQVSSGDQATMNCSFGNSLSFQWDASIENLLFGSFDGASDSADTSDADERSNSTGARGGHNCKATHNTEMEAGANSSLKSYQSNVLFPQVEQAPQGGASNDAEMADAAEGTQDDRASPGEDLMCLESQSYPYEMKPNDRFFEAVRSGQKGKKEVIEMIEADRSVVNSCNSESTKTALQAAAHEGRLWMVNKLLEEGANPCPRLPNSPLIWARHSPLEIVTQFMIQTEVVKIIRSYYDRTHGKFVLPQDKDAIEEFDHLKSTLEKLEEVQMAGLRLPKEYFRHYRVKLSIDERFCLGKFVQKFDKERNPTKARPKISYPFSGEDGTFMAIYYDYDDQDMIDDALGLWKSGEFMKYKDWKCENEACPCRGNDSPYNRSQVQRPKI